MSDRGRLIHRHLWTPVRVRHVRDAEFGTMRTDVNMRCEKCPKVKLKSLKGVWQLADLLPLDEGGEG